jgi:signal transduction histidine kinase
MLVVVTLSALVTWALCRIPAVSETLQTSSDDVGLVVLLTVLAQATMFILYRRVSEKTALYGLSALAEQCIKAGGVMWLIYRSHRADSFFWLVHVTSGVINANIPQYRRILAALFVGFPVLLIVAFAANADWANAGVALIATSLATMVFYISSFVSIRYANLMDERERLARELADLRVRDDRVRIARDLHDGIGADLAALAWKARRVQAELGDSALSGQLSEMTDRASHSIDDLRSIVWALREKSQTWEELVAYVRQRCHELCAEHARLEVEDLSAGDGRALPGDLCLHVVRSAQEAVRNAVRHGHARTIRIRLEAGPEIRLCVEDDGCGIPPEALRRNSGGLANLRARATAMGGSLTVEPCSPGTRLTVRLVPPLPAIAEAG